MRVLDSREVTKVTSRDLFNQGLESFGSIVSTVQSIVDDVRTRGDDALLAYTSQFDGVELTPETLIASQEEIDAAYALVPATVIEALQHAKQNIATFHQAQLREEWQIETEPGVTVGQIWRPIEFVGLYAPGGRAAYPSSVLMAATPAKIAGVQTLVLATPPSRDGTVNPAILVAAHESGVDIIVKAGGAQAIAALAYGTATVPQVLKIVGPGNKYVMAAKQLVSSVVAIDMPAGPSEILVIVDDYADPYLAVLDLFSQVEHDPENIGILVVPSEELARTYEQKIEEMLPQAPRNEIVQSALDTRGTIIVCLSKQEVFRVTNLIGPEHLEIFTENPRDIMGGINNAGAIFLGANSPVPIGDFSAGSNHILPTGGYSKQYSGLTTLDFVKLIDFVECTPEGLVNCGPAAIEIAKFEGFGGHAATISTRLKNQEEI